MKIKRLTAGLAVAAMAATFFAAAPVLSAQAATGASTTTVVNWDTGSAANALADPVPIGTVSGYSGNTPTTMSPVDTSTITSQLINKVVNQAVGTSQWTDQYGHNPSLANLLAPTSTSFGGWPCTGAYVTDSNGNNINGGIQGTAGCVNGKITYTPAKLLGVNGTATVTIAYQLLGTLVDANGVPLSDQQIETWAAITNKVAVHGFGTITVTSPGPSGCGALSGACITADFQAWGKYDDPVVEKIDLIKPNVFTTRNANGQILSGDQGFWAVYSIDGVTTTDYTLAPQPSKLLSWLSYVPGKSTSVTFSAPQYWSGEVDYTYAVARYVNGVQDLNAGILKGILTIIVHPTLTAPDPIVSDPGANVTVPLLGTGSLAIVGSKPFANASCVFASNNKIKDPAVGVINNKQGTKNPIFTPNADFQGSVDLNCTVEDAFGTVSNTVTVTIQVGTPAPAPVVPAAPTSAAPACSAAGTCPPFTTGGSLAAPMSSGLAAVVLLVAAGAGILVVRRRTSLAG